MPNDSDPPPLDDARSQEADSVRPVRKWRRTAAVGLVAALFCLLLISIIVPLLGRQREPAKRVICASNMKQIGLGAIMYANAHGGQLPDDLQTILKDEDLEPHVFNCPDANETPASGPTTQAILRDFRQPGHLSYIYVGKGLKTDAAASVVILYEPLKNHANDGMNVLFVDGHVEWLSAADAQSIVNQDAAGVRPIQYPPSANPAPAQ